jgi:DNA invertase Pin-like site-specific DNA recombinase
MIQAIAYVRVSTKEQGQSGFGLQSQEATIQGYAQAAGYRLVKVYRETASAIKRTADERPELQNALEHARREKLPLIVRSLDRLSRHAADIESIVRKSGITIIDVINGPHADSIVIKTQAARVAEETKMLSERTKAGLLRAKQQGKIFGNRRNLREAQRMGAEATKRNAQQRDMEIAPTILGAPGSTPSEIAAQLNRAGYCTARGRSWSAANLRRVIRRIHAEQQRAEQERAEQQRRAQEDPLFGMF